MVQIFLSCLFGYCNISQLLQNRAGINLVNLNQGKIKLPKLHPSFFESGISHSYPYLRNKYFMKERILKMEINDCVAFM